MATILKLPPELLIRVAKYLRRTDLHHFRLASKAFEYPGAYALLAYFILVIDRNELPHGAQQLMQSPKLMKCISHLDLYLFDDCYENVALNFIATLSTLSSLTFDMAYGSDQSARLQSIFTLLHKKPSHLRYLSLSIRHGFDAPTNGMLEDEPTISVIQSVHNLHLHLGPYFDSYRVSRSQMDPEVSSLMPPSSTWLSRHFTNLRRLVLAFGDGWTTNQGFAPKLDFRHTHFQRLEYLSLSHFLVCHDWVLDWLMKHGATLEVLDLAFTPILRERVTGDFVDEEGFPVRHPGRSAEVLPRSTYERTWREVFGLLYDQFPRLRAFTLIYFAGRISDETEANEVGPCLTQGLYVRSAGHSLSTCEIIPQSRKMGTLEDALLLSDETALHRLVDKIGKDNFTFQAARDVNLPDIDTSESLPLQCTDALDDWTVDSHGNVFTSSPLPQRSPRE